MVGMASSARAFITTCSHCNGMHLHLLALKSIQRHLQQHLHASALQRSFHCCNAWQRTGQCAATKPHLRGEAGGDAPVDADAFWDGAPIGAGALIKAMRARNPGAPCRHGERPWPGWDACMHAPA